MLQIFINVNSTTEEVKLAGTKIFQWIYSKTNKKDFPKTLHELRYEVYNFMAAKGKIDPERLPPTEDVVQQHLPRAYLQLQDWMVLKCSSREASNYGCENTSHGLEPIGMTNSIAPEEMQKLVLCSCWVPRRLLEHERRELGS